MKTTSELFEFITSQPKWYIGIPSKNGFHNAQSANRLKNRYKNNKLSEKSMSVIFEHFGYTKNESLWTMKI